MFSAKSIPNVLSIIRIIMVPVFAVVFFNDYPNNIIWALGIFIISGITDVIDGYLARRNNWITDLGKILDPLADKMMQCTVLICLYIMRIIPVWLLVVYIIKELLMLCGGFVIMKKKDLIVVSSWWGKAAVCVFYAAVFTLMMFSYYGYENTALTVTICAVTLLIAVAALFAYAAEYRKKIKQKQ